MRYLNSAVGMIVALAILTPTAALCASDLSIVGYDLVTETRVTRSQWYATYKAKLLNNGPAVTAVTASVTSPTPSVQISPGQGTVHFGAVGSNAQVTSNDTFTILVDRSFPFDLNTLNWSFVVPFANAGPNQTVSLNGTVLLNAGASINPTGAGTLTYHWSFVTRPPRSNAVLINPDSVVASFVVDVPGNYVLNLLVTNGVEHDTATVTVSTVNSPPVANAGPNLTTILGSTLILNGGGSSDVDGDTITYLWTLTSKPAGSTAFLGGYRSVSANLVADKAGAYVVQLVVNDGHADSAASTATITTVNTPPVANAGSPQVVGAGALVQLNGAASTDVDGDSLTYTWSLISAPAGSVAALSDSHLVNPTFTADLVGPYVAQLVVNDGNADGAPATVLITMLGVQAPAADAGPNQTVAHNAVVQLSGAGSDPQSLPLAPTWSLIARPAGSTAVLSSATILNPTFVADRPGVYVAQLIVNNGSLNSVPATMTVTTANTAPVANPGTNQTVSPGVTVTLDGTASSDADFDSLTYSWSFTNRPAGSTAVLSSANTALPSFVADLPGIYIAQLIVNDGFASSNPVTVTVTAVGAMQITVTPNPLNLVISQGTLSVLLSAVAGPGGVLVDLTGFNSNIISMPDNVLVPENTMGANVTVTPVGSGSTTVLASSSGYQSGVATVNVSTPTISVTLSAPGVGVTRTISGTVTLSAPAPAGPDTIVTLSGNGVSFDPQTVAVAPGATTGAFNMTGVTAGVPVITASSPGYASGTVTVFIINLGAISLASNVTVAPGQSAPINVILSSPAPAGGTTVTLSSGDPLTATVTPSVFIQQGFTAPLVQPQVTGVNVGTATISASSLGYTGASQSVQVTGALAIITASLPSGNTNTGYSQSLAAVGGTGTYTWSILTGVLPSGMSLNPASGLISGTPTVAVTNLALTFKVTDTSQPAQTATKLLALTINAPLVITTSLLQNGQIGAPYSQTLFATGGAGAHTWSLTSGTLPDGLTFNTATGQISGTPTATAASTPLTFQTTDSGTPPQSVSVNLTLTVTSSMVIVSAALPTGQVGVPYSYTLFVVGGTGTKNWSITAGSLPNGLTFGPANGQISGTPLAGVTNLSLTFQVTDSGSPQQTATATLTLTVAGPLAITTTSLADGQQSSPYSQTLAATGGIGTRTWALIGGSLPNNLSLNPTTGLISGTATVPVTALPLTFQVTDSGSPAQTASVTLTLTVAPVLTISTASLPNGQVGSPYSLTLGAAGGTGARTWALTGGVLPAGLTLTPATGLISGTPLVAANSTPLTLRVTDSGSPAQNATVTLPLMIIGPLVINTTSLPSGQINVFYSQTLTASGGTGAHTWLQTGGALPNGLTLNPATGLISGTPLAAVTNSSLTFQTTDSGSPAQTATVNLTLTIAGSLAITTSSLPNGQTGSFYSQTLNATGGTGPLTWALISGTLPTGISLNPTIGQISGTPTATATNAPLTFRVTDSGSPAQTKTVNLTLTVIAPLVITTTTLPGGQLGAFYSQTLAATGGTGSRTWLQTAGALPNGLTLNPATGQISGTPTVGVTNTPLTFQVLDSGSPAQVATVNLTLTIASAPLSITTTSLPTGHLNTAYNATLAATGGVGPYTWTLIGGRMANGLSLSPSGQITGTPIGTVTGSALTFRVTDSGSSPQSATVTLSLTIN